MKEAVVAMRYARGFFAFAKDKKAAEKWLHELARAKAACAAIPHLIRGLGDQAIATDRRLTALAEIGSLLELSRETANFLKLLIAKARIALLPQMVDAYQKLVEDYQQVASADVTVAEDALAQETEDQIHAILKTLLKKKASCRVTVDPDILGGFTIRVDDTVYDASLRGRLKRMKEELLS